MEGRTMYDDKDAPYTVKELLVALLARELADGERAIVGYGLVVPRAAVLLAHLLHGPNMKVSVALMRSNLFEETKLDTFELMTDWRVGRVAEYYIKLDEIFEGLDRITDLCFISGIQVDKYGNTNLVGLKGEGKAFKMRGAGCGGSTALAALAKRCCLYMEKHDKRRFVEKCDYISAIGWGTPEMGSRESLKLPGGGPKLVFTPLCIMDFDPQTKQMRLQSVHPKISIDEVVENTGFDLIIPENVGTTTPPTTEELEVLRSRVDPKGLLCM
jgi:glutaconate CoA-transferase subunit B